MSFIKVPKVQIGTNVDATKNFVLSANNDGTAKLARGTVDGTTQDILGIGVAGNLTSLVGISNPILHVRDEKPTTTEGGPSIAGSQVRTLNTVVINSIAGASLAANQITLPAGTYKIDANAPGYNVARHRARLVNSTDAVVILLGSSEHNGGSVGTRSRLVGTFTLAAVKTVNITHFTQVATVTYGLGVETNDGFVNIYTEVFIEKIG